MHCYAPYFQEVEGANWFGPVRLSIQLSPPLHTPPPPTPPDPPPTPKIWFLCEKNSKNSLTLAPLPSSPLPHHPPPQKKKKKKRKEKKKKSFLDMDLCEKKFTYSSPEPPSPLHHLNPPPPDFNLYFKCGFIVKKSLTPDPPPPTTPSPPPHKKKKKKEKKKKSFLDMDLCEKKFTYPSPVPLSPLHHLNPPPPPPRPRFFLYFKCGFIVKKITYSRPPTQPPNSRPPPHNPLTPPPPPMFFYFWLVHLCMDFKIILHSFCLREGEVPF